MSELNVQIKNEHTKLNSCPKLAKFLTARIVNRDEDYTHTTKVPSRRIKINPEDLDEFYDLYCDSVISGNFESVTEKCPEIVPIIVDVDYKTNYELGSTRKYKPQHLRNIIGVYHEIIEEIVVKPKKEHFICCVMEKCEPTSTNGKYKDGFHLIFPFIHTELWVQRDYIRPQVLERVSARKYFADIPTTDPISSIFDKQVPGNVWMMYGSKKEPSANGYTLSKVYNKDLEIIQNKDLFSSKLFEKGNKIWNLPKFFSLNETHSRDCPELKDTVKKPVNYKKVKVFHKKTRDQILEDLKVSENLMGMLKDERAESYGDWIEVGWILFNIGEGDQKALDQWINFSKKSAKFEEGVCEKAWGKMEMRHYTLGSLKHLAKVDSPNDYYQHQNSLVDAKLEEGLNQAHNDIAKILWMMYEGKYICADLDKDGIWYEFRGHRWVHIQKGLGLRQCISKELTDKYLRLMAKYINQSQSEQTQDSRDSATDKINLINKLIQKLKNNSFKNAVMKEAMEFFYDEYFVERMDENKDLLVFENGVYDAKAMIFRDGRPDDYCTKSTKLFYHTSMNKHDHRIVEIRNILKKTFVNKKLLKFFEQTASDLILGGNRHKIFVIWTGEGDNGKSIIADLLDHAFGDYFYTPPTTLLTGKQNQASGATAELLPCKGAKAVIVSETGNADVLNCGVMKKLTGGDPFYARGLFKEPTKINPHFKLILHCNKMPNISAEDKASWNRIRVLPFESTFVNAEVAPASEEEQWTKKIFPKDNTLKDRIPELAEAFMWLLINLYQKIGNSSLYEPPEVKEATNKYHKTNDFYLQFIDERIKQTGKTDDMITFTVIWQMFKEWFKDSYPSRKAPEKMDLENSLIKYLGKHNKYVWRGFAVYDPNDEDPI